MKFSCLIFFFVLFSCASSSSSLDKISQSKQVALSQSISIPISRFKDILPKNALINQWIHYSRKGKSERAQVLIKNFEELSVSILSPFGIELMSLSFRAGSIKKISGIPGIKVDFFERAMVDMILIYGEQNLIESLIGNQGKLRGELHKRALFAGENEVINISYSEADPWKSNIEYKHLELDYKLKIKTVSINYETIYK